MTKTFVADEVLTAADTNAFLRNRVYKMTPSSVAGSGAAIASNGSVTLTAANTFSLNGVFTSDFSVYEVLFSFPTTSANLTINVRLRAAGTDDSGSVYDVQSLASNGASATPVAANLLAATSWVVTSATGTRLHVGNIVLYQPFEAMPTLMETRSFSTLNPATAATTTALTLRSGLHRNSTSFDGITIIPSGGTLTGTVAVFGMW